MKRGGGRCHYLLLLNDIDPCLDVGEGMHGGQDGFPLVLLIEFPPRPPTFCEWRSVHEAAKVEVLLKVGEAVFHLIVIKERLHKGNLYVCLM